MALKSQDELTIVMCLLIVLVSTHTENTRAMNDKSSDYLPLDAATLADRLVSVPALSDRLGSVASEWRVREVGDGNLNLVFIVESVQGAVVVKQALPYVRLVGDSWPLPLSRSFFEYNALTRQAHRAPGTVPEIYYFDEVQAMVVMEFLSPHHILRHSLQQGITHAGLGKLLGHFCADTLFKGSDLYMDAAERKKDVALFAGNAALCDITESLVFTDPYFDAPMNRHTSPQLDDLVASLRADADAKIAAQTLKTAFCSQAQTMLHGDLHTGSVMVSGSDAKVIDPEFALYGPIGFDVGMLIANFIMAWCAQPAYATAEDDRDDYRGWILSVITDVWSTFEQQFSHLWHTQRTGILFPKTLFEDQGDNAAVERALRLMLDQIWLDAMGFCGAEIIRRTLGLAHIAEYDDIEDAAVKAQCEAVGLQIGRTLMVDGCNFSNVDAVFSLMQEKDKESGL
jgi:5-methylthioribose kinase